MRLRLGKGKNSEVDSREPFDERSCGALERRRVIDLTLNVEVTTVTRINSLLLPTRASALAKA